MAKQDPAYRRAYYLANKEKILKQNAQWKKDNPEASARHDKAAKEKHKDARKLTCARWRENNKEKIKVQHTKHRASPRGRASQIVAYAKKRSVRQKVPFDLEIEDVVGQLEKGTCEVTGIPFQKYPGAQGPYSPSIDRKAPELGYVKGNIQIVVWALNAARGWWGDEILWSVVAARWPDRVKALPKAV